MIKKFISIACLAASIASPLFAVTKNKPFQEYNFSKGLDSYHNSQSLSEGFVQDANNVLFDDRAPVTKRSGFSVAWSTKTYSFTGLWTYTDATNTIWQLARSSDQITANNLAGTIVVVATVSVNNIIGEANAFGNAYFVDQTQGVYYWNGTLTTFVSGSPKGSIITQFHNRLWVTGAAVPNGNQLYGSKYYDGTTWTTGLNATDPVQYSIGLQDNFDNTTAEYVYLDTLYIFKHGSIFALYGFDQTSFQISQLTQECGCIDIGSIQTYNGGLEFVSLRGVESFNGYTCKRISDGIKNKVDPAVQASGFSQQSWVLQNTSDWTSGTFNPSNSLSSADAPPALVLSTGNFTDAVTSDFSGGTFQNTKVVGNTVLASTDNVNLNNNGFETGDFTHWVNTAPASTINTTFSGSDCTLSPRTGTYFLFDGGAGDTAGSYSDIVYLQTCTGSNITSVSILQAANSCTWTSRTLSSSGQTGKSLRVQISPGAGSGGTVTSECFISSGKDITFYTSSNYLNTVNPPHIGNAPIAYDDFTDGRSDIFSSTFTSRSFNSGINSFIFYSTASYTISLDTITFNLQTSPDNSTWSTVSTSTGVNVTTTGPYLRYQAIFASTSTADTLSTWNGLNYNLTATSGTFKSPIHNFGVINSFGNFSTQNQLNNGNIAYSLCSSTASNMIPDNCAVQTPNSQITVSTGTNGSGTYVQWYATFTVTASTQTPTLQSGTVQVFSGTKPTPMSSIVWDNRYWLSLTTNTVDTINDAVLVLNKNSAWTVFDIHAGAFTQSKNSLYHADSNATGNIYLDNQGLSDNGASINSYIRTRTLGLGDFAADDYLYVIYPSVISDGNCAMNVTYQMDKSGTNYSLGSPLLNEFATLTSVRLPFPVDSSHQDFGQSIDFTFGTNDSQCSFQFFGYEGLFKSRPLN